MYKKREIEIKYKEKTIIKDIYICESEETFIQYLKETHIHSKIRTYVLV
jgi:hypothetical protein